MHSGDLTPSVPPCTAKTSYKCPIGHTWVVKTYMVFPFSSGSRELRNAKSTQGSGRASRKSQDMAMVT